MNKEIESSIKYPEITIIVHGTEDDINIVIGKRTTGLGDVAEQELQSLKDEGIKYINTSKLKQSSIYKSLNKKDAN